MITGIVSGIIVIVVAIGAFIGSTAFFNDDDHAWGVGLLILGLFCLSSGSICLVFAPINYYQKRIPTLTKQVLEYEKDQIELKLGNLKEK